MVKYKNPRNNKTNKELVRVDERENKIPRPPAWFSSWNENHFKPTIREFNNSYQIIDSIESRINSLEARIDILERKVGINDNVEKQLPLCKEISKKH